MTGEVFLDLIEQDVVWRTSDGRVLALEEMESSHRASVLRMLERMAHDLYAEWVDEFLVDGFSTEELAARGIGERDLDTDEYDNTEVSAWFAGQPLVSRLHQLSDARLARRTPWRP